MNYNLYVIYDKVAQQYGAPFVSLNDATATRQFTHQISQNLMAEPSDFELYCCGIFSTDTGKIVPQDTLRFLRKGQVIVNAEA